MGRWAIYIDIEGFGALWEAEDRSLRCLNGLMEAVYLIGTNVFPESPTRLFAHQIGDGFIIVSEFGAESLGDPISIAIVLMRKVVETGCIAKAAIAEGDLADIQGCYPKVIRDALRDENRVGMGQGIMTTFSVMGTALIRAVGISKKFSGGLLMTHKRVRDRLPSGLIVREIPGTDVLTVDWVHSNVPRVKTIQEQAHLNMWTTEALENAIRGYLEKEEASPTWKLNTKCLLAL